MNKKVSGPTSICIAASVVMAIGVYDAIQMVFEWFQGEVNFNLNILLIGLGWGALKGREGCRLLISIFFFFIPATAFAIALPLAFFFSKKLTAAHEPFALVVYVLGGASILWLGLIHFRADESSWFKGEAKDTKNLRYTVAICAVFLGVGSGFTKYRIHRHLDQIYQYDVKIIARDTDTKEMLRPNLSMSGGAMPRSVEGVKMPSGLFSVTFSASSREGGTISGLAHSNLEVEVSAKGYLPETVIISKSQKDRVEVYLKKEVEPTSVDD